MSGPNNQAVLEGLTNFFNFLSREATFHSYQDQVVIPPVAPQQPPAAPKPHLVLVQELLNTYKQLITPPQNAAASTLEQQKLRFLIEHHLQGNYFSVQMLRLQKMLSTLRLSAQEQQQLTKIEDAFKQAFADFCSHAAELQSAATDAEAENKARSCMQAWNLLAEYYREAFNFARQQAKDEASKKLWLEIFTAKPHGPVIPLGQLTLFSPVSLKNLADSQTSKARFKFFNYPTKASVFLSKTDKQYGMQLTFCPFASYQDTLDVNFMAADQGFSAYLQDVNPREVQVDPPEQFILVAEKLFNAYLMMYMAAERSLLESTGKVTLEDLNKLPVTLYMDLLDNNPNEPPAFTAKRVAIAKAAYALFETSRKNPDTGKHPLIKLQFVNEPPLLSDTQPRRLQEILRPIDGQDFAGMIEEGSKKLLKKHTESCETSYKKLDTLKVLPARFKPQPPN